MLRLARTRLGDVACVCGDTFKRLCRALNPRTDMHPGTLSSGSPTETVPHAGVARRGRSRPFETGRGVQIPEGNFAPHPPTLEVDTGAAILGVSNPGNEGTSKGDAIQQRPCKCQAAQTRGKSRSTSTDSIDFCASSVAALHLSNREEITNESAVAANKDGRSEPELKGQEIQHQKRPPSFFGPLSIDFTVETTSCTKSLTLP